MKKILIASMALLVISCGKEIKSLSDLQSNFYAFQQKPLHMEDALNITFLENEDKIDSISILINGNRIQNNEKITAPTTHLGSNLLELNVYIDGKSIYGKTTLAVLNPVPETPVEFEILKQYPHATSLFTQGFFYHDQMIYESSGQYGKSKLVTYDLGALNFKKEINLDPKLFAEGAEIIDGKVYQLTFRERKILVYDAKTLDLIDTLEMPAEVKEGWGLTSNGEELIISDGTQNIYFFDKNLTFNRKIQVTGNVSIYTHINEMEFIDGKIFANVWLTPYILVIDPATGAVEKYYDFKEIDESVGDDDVLNGIALYGKNILVTGKNWKNIYEVNLP